MQSFITPILNGHDHADVSRAASLIVQGGLVAFATETVYGLGALGLDEISLRKIFAAKNRPTHNPLILHVADAASAAALFDFERCEYPADARNYFDLLSQNFWPGPLTIVCAKTALVPSVATANLLKVAVRVPNHPIAIRFLREINAPVAAPSANASGRPSATTAEHVRKTLDGKIDAILDAGPCSFGVESTVVDISERLPSILRTGAISLQKLREILPEIQLRDIGHATHDSQGSPGRIAKHYAPLIGQIRVVGQDKLAAHWKSSTAIMMRAMSAERLVQELGSRPEGSGALEILPNEPSAYAHELYGAFYRLESSNSDSLIIEEVPLTEKDGLWLTILDRLARAAS